MKIISRNAMVKMTTRFSKLDPKARLAWKVSGMCRIGRKFFIALCHDTTDLRFFGHYCDNKCPQ